MRSSNLLNRISQKVRRSSNQTWYSLQPQITEHRCVELKDQEISKETKQRFEKLKGKYPKVFSVNSEDIGWTNLITMHVDTGDNPPICQKLYTLPLKHYSWVQQEIETLECTGVIQEKHQPLGQSNSGGTQEISTWWSPKMKNVRGFQKNQWTPAQNTKGRQANGYSR